ncbi:hypothetical protein V6N11_070345 [Hibiscus sabdariffa]|uniref:MATH domain-containing protein n=1 Tax=Hibiscus sabdariffa TaxID=183260 RepID=A0ABR2QES1_9ROSI
MFTILSAGSGSNLPKVIWRVEVLNSKSQSKDGNGEITKVTWRIQNFSSFKKDQMLRSENISVDGNKWRIDVYPKGNNVDHLSIFLTAADSATLPSGWTRFAQYGLAVIDQTDRRNSIARVLTYEFNARDSSWGYPSFLALNELEDPKRGYLINDACLVEAYISTDRTDGLISHELMLETDSDKHETKENQTTMKIESAIEPEEPTDQDIDTFFSGLESKLLNSKIVVSQEEAKEALAKLDEAMNMTPVDFYNSGKFSPLKQAFKILASFKCSSTTLTIEQKNELLAMEESLKEVADRAAKAVEDKKHLSQMESMKLTITHNLDRNLVKYKEVESEVRQVDQKLAAFQQHVEEAQKEKEKMLDERNGIFRSSKRMKVELEALEKKWAEYEAKAEVAEKEEKAVEAEWERMKDFISSLKGKI